MPKKQPHPVSKELVKHKGFRLTKSEDEVSFTSRKKFPSGMTGEIAFDLYGVENDPSKLIIDISFVVYRKRKSAWSVPNEITGQDGAQTLVWAKSEIDAFSEYIWRFSPAKDADLVIGWTDKRRGDLYIKALCKRGFTVTTDEGEIVLKKRIQRVPLSQRRYSFENQTLNL